MIQEKEKSDILEKKSVLNNTVIVYASRFGASKKVSKHISDILRNKYSMNVDLLNIKKKKGKIDLNQYNNVIFGSGIMGDKWPKEALKLLKNDFSKKKIAIFVTSGNAGEALEKNDQKLYQKWQYQYISAIIAPYQINPVSIKAFGGHFRFFGIKLYDKLDFAPINAWADELGKLLV